MSNPDNAHNLGTCPDKKKRTEKIEPTNQAKTKIKIAKGLKTDFEKYLATYQGFKIHNVVF